MWLLKAIQTEMRLGRLNEVLTYNQIKQKCIDNGIKPGIYTSSDGKFCEFGITDEEFDKLFGYKENPNVQ